MMTYTEISNTLSKTNNVCSLFMRIDRGRAHDIGGAMEGRGRGAETKSKSY